uniref:Secreted protein n=1 Tax=Heterorhabditis bacteriophora TaxID=37862 RepID=A0A1I7WXG5_HETBA
MGLLNLLFHTIKVSMLCPFDRRILVLLGAVRVGRRTLKSTLLKSSPQHCNNGTISSYFINLDINAKMSCKAKTLILSFARVYVLRSYINKWSTSLGLSSTKLNNCKFSINLQTIFSKSIYNNNCRTTCVEIQMAKLIFSDFTCATFWRARGPGV